MKNLLLLSILTGAAAWGGPCTTAVGSTHIFATCALGDRTFSAFAATSGAPHVLGGAGQSGGTGADVLVPFAQASLERVRSATPQSSDHGLLTAIAAVSGTHGRFEEPARQLPVDIPNTIGHHLNDNEIGVPFDNGLVPLEPKQKDQSPTLVLSPNLGTDRPGTGPESPIVSPDLPEMGDHVTEMPEPATYASIGLGLIGLWCLSRRSRRTPDKG